MSGRRAARHAQTSGLRRGLIGGAIAVAAVAVVLILAMGGLPGTTSGPSDREPDRNAASQPSGGEGSGTATSGSSGGRSSSAARARTTLRACKTSVQQAERAVAAAGVGVAHWHSHVKARTDMLQGQISEKRMNEVWTRTQAAGPRDEKRWQEALRAYDQPSTCSRVRGVPASERSDAAHCVQRSRAATRALSHGQAAMKDWKVHLANMAKFAHNKMSASMAQGRWVKAWRNAPKNISAYGAARAALAKAPRCPAAGS